MARVMSSPITATPSGTWTVLICRIWIPFVEIASTASRQIEVSRKVRPAQVNQLPPATPRTRPDSMRVKSQHA